MTEFHAPTRGRFQGTDHRRWAWVWEDEHERVVEFGVVRAVRTTRPLSPDEVGWLAMMADGFDQPEGRPTHWVWVRWGDGPDRVTWHGPAQSLEKASWLLERKLLGCAERGNVPDAWGIADAEENGMPPATYDG